MRGRQRLVLVVAAVVGIAGGVVTAVVAPGASEPDEGSLAVNDPLRLGIAQVSLSSCTDEAVLILGSGDTAAALTPIVADAGEDARYLRTDESCATVWAEGEDVPAYVVYDGPYDTEVEPCRVSVTDACRPGDQPVGRQRDVRAVRLRAADRGARRHLATGRAGR